MKRIVCEMCGSTDIMKEDGVYVCQSCGTKYSVEEARKMMVEISGTVDVSGSTVKVDNTESVEAQLKRGFLFLEDSNFGRADQCFEKALNLDPYNAEAYLGKLMTEYKCPQKSMLKNLKKPFSSSDNYIKVMRFGEEALKAEIKGYNDHIIDCNERAAKAAEEARNRKETEKIALRKKLNIFLGIDPDPESARKVEEENKRYKEAIKPLVEAVEAEKKKAQTAVNNTRKDYVEKRNGIKTEYEVKIKALNEETENYQKELDSLGLFAGKRKKELQQLISEKKEKISYLKTELEREEATVDLELIAQEGLLNSEYERAKKELEREDSRHEGNLERLKGKRGFGRYPTASNGKPEPIEWEILDVDPDNRKALVISKYALDCQHYNTSFSYVNWETCSLRKWLNGTFLNNAFSSEEQSLIAKTTIKYENLYEDFGHDTNDKVFLLSVKETAKFFSSDSSRRCAPTAYARAQGVWTSDDYKTAEGKATCWWWLRYYSHSPGLAPRISNDGSVCPNGYRVYYDYSAVRPALWIDLSKTD